MSRVLNASGCLDAIVAPDVARTLDVFVSKTVTPAPREGNAPVRIAEVGPGMLNSIGLANPGIETFVRETLPALEGVGVPLWVSVGGFDAADYALCCEALEPFASVETIELNVSCPNVTAPVDAASAIVAAARRATAKPLYAKLSPTLPDLPSVALAAADAGADGLTLTNALRGMAIDRATLRPTIATVTAGLTGPALRPVALAAVYSCARVTELPIVGVGGIESGEGALAFLAAGASDVAVGTALFSDPDAATRVRAELEALCRGRGFATPAEAIGLAHEPDAACLRRPRASSGAPQSLPELATTQRAS